jgi:hypothetical protein
MCHTEMLPAAARLPLALRVRLRLRKPNTERGAILMRVYHYLEAKWALDDIRRNRLKLSKIDDMNDPYEWRSVRSNHKSTQSTLEKTEKEIAELHSVLCFSESWDNILMWSHYGDRHKGICLGFDVPKEMTRTVKYVSDIFVVGDFDELSRREKVAALNRLYETKYRGWSYEREVRFHGNRVERDEETGQYFVGFSKRLRLKEVIAGVRFPMSRKPIEDALEAYSDVKIIKAGASTTRFEIIVDKRGFNSSR